MKEQQMLTESTPIYDQLVSEFNQRKVTPTEKVQSGRAARRVRKRENRARGTR